MMSALPRSSVPARWSVFLHHCVALAAIFMGAAAVTSSGAVAEGKPDWDRVANIREAAHRLVGIQNERGALGTLKFIAACYQTQMLAARFSAPLEACIAQDFILTQTLAMIYDRMPPDKRKQMGAPEPSQLAAGLSQRVGTALAHYKMSEADGNRLRDLVEAEGFPLFFKERFPKAAQ